jgi:hypothetical protein
MDTKVNQVVEVVPSSDEITSELQKVMINDDYWGNVTLHMGEVV